MANRFVRLIEEGAIASVDELKSSFRALALATHPDLGGAEGRSEDFIRARSEYEAALLYLDSGGGRGRGVRASAFRSTAGARRAFDRAVFYADLAALLKAGFPKTPRHDKERRKYARLRLLVRSALASRAEDAPARFDAFERALAGLKECAVVEPGRTGAAGGPRQSAAGTRAAAVLGLLADLVEYEETGIVALRSVIEIELAGLRAEAAAAAADTVAQGGEWARAEEAEAVASLFGFLSFLAADMEGGPALG